MDTYRKMRKDRRKKTWMEEVDGILIAMALQYGDWGDGTELLILLLIFLKK